MYRKTSSIVSQNARNVVVLYFTMAKKTKNFKNYAKNKFSSKIIYSHETGCQVEQFGEKNRKSEFSWYYPFKLSTIHGF
jgi:hypothetical protein